MKGSKQILWCAAGSLLGVSLGMLAARFMGPRLADATAERQIAEVPAVEKPKEGMPFRPEPPSQPGATIQARLFPEGMDFKSARFSLAAATRHFLESAAENPEAFGELVAANARKMPPDVLAAALWALTPHAPEHAMMAAANVPGQLMRGQAAAVIAQAWPLAQVGEPKEAASRLKLGAGARSEFLGIISQRQAAADPEWATQELKTLNLSGKNDRFLLSGLAEAGMDALTQALKSLPDGRIPADMAGAAIAHAGLRDIAQTVRDLDTIVESPAERAWVVSQLLAALDSSQASVSEFEALSQAAQGSLLPVDSSPWVTNQIQTSLIRLSLELRKTDQAVALLDTMPPSPQKNQIQSAAALALNNNNREGSFRWLVKNEGATDKDARGGPLGFFIMDWGMKHPGELEDFLRKNPDAPGSTQMSTWLGRYR